LKIEKSKISFRMNLPAGVSCDVQSATFDLQSEIPACRQAGSSIWNLCSRGLLSIIDSYTLALTGEGAGPNEITK
jgi:hypothetical protein